MTHRDDIFDLRQAARLLDLRNRVIGPDSNDLDAHGFEHTTDPLGSDTNVRECPPVGPLTRRLAVHVDKGTDLDALRRLNDNR